MRRSIIGVGWPAFRFLGGLIDAAKAANALCSDRSNVWPLQCSVGSVMAQIIFSIARRMPAICRLRSGSTRL